MEAKCITLLQKILLILLVVAISASFLFHYAKKAESDPLQNKDYISNNLIVKDNAIQKPAIKNDTSNSIGGIGKSNKPSQTNINGRHSTRAEKQISEVSLRLYLDSKGSPLSQYVPTLLNSPYWSTIIGICTIEQYSCTHALYNNYWGLMKPGGGLQKFAAPEDGIKAINDFLTKAESNGRTTIESFRGWYCASACTNWESTVLKVKAQVENLQ